MKNNVFAEVTQSSLEYYKAQCWDWDRQPTFGSVVITQANECCIVGIVTYIATQPYDSSRVVVPYKKTMEQLAVEHPEIFYQFKTEFIVQIIGYYFYNNKKIHYILPDKPPAIHAFIYAAEKYDYEFFFNQAAFIYLLYHYSKGPVILEDIILALMKHLKYHDLLTKCFIKDVYQTLSLLTNNDYRRINVFFQRLESFYTD